MRVVPETEGPPPVEHDDSLTRTLRHDLEPVREYGHGNATVTTGTFCRRHAVECGNKFGIVVLIGRGVARVACRSNPGGAVERVHLDARVIRDRRQPGHGHHRAGFRQCVVGVGVVVLVQGKVGGDVVQCDQFDLGEEDLDLLGLVPIARSEYRFQPASAFS